MKKILALFTAVFALLNLASCTVYVDDSSGRVIGVGPQAIRMGRGFLPQSPLAGGAIIAGGSVVAGGLCSPSGPGYRAGFATYPLPQPWGRVYPHGSCASPGHPSRWGPTNAFGGQGYPPNCNPNPRVGAPWQYPWTPPNIRPGCAGPGYGGVPVRWY